jgi:predicted permease
MIAGGRDGVKHWWNWRRRDAELEKEIQHHLRMAEAERAERGVSWQEAKTAARHEFGNVGMVKELAHDVWGGRWLRDIAEDARYGLRILAKNPGSTVVVIVALALGIGMNATVFSFVNALLLRPPAGVEASGNLYELWLHDTRSSGVEGYVPLTYPDYANYRDHNQSFGPALAFDGDPESVIWNRSGEGQILWGQLVSGNFFSLLGVHPVLGRSFSEEDDQVAHPRAVIVLGHAFWQQRLASDPAIIGKALMLNGVNYSVVGVAPPGFAGLLVGVEPDFWAPITMVQQITQDKERLSNWQGYWLFVVGRLKSETGVSAADAEGNVLEHQVEVEHPELKRVMEIKVFPATLIPGPYRHYVSAFTTLLMAVFVLVLLIACANVASLLLARATGRTREMAVRSALGAGRGRLIRQLLVESTVLSGLAGLAGLALAYCAAPALLALKPASLPINLRVPLDWRVLMFTLLLSLFCGIAFGLSPALRSAKVQASANLKDEAQGASYGKSRLRSILVTCEVATCAVLLVGAALCLRSLRNASSIDPGFSTQHVVAATLDPGSLGYSHAQIDGFYAQLSEHIRTLPGVRSVGFINHLPLGAAREESGVAEDKGSVASEDETHVDVLRVAPGYFQTMGIPLLRGRDFTERETGADSKVAIINTALAERLWRNSDPLDRRMRIHKDLSVEIIGVVTTGKYRTLGEDPTPVVYLPQLPASRTLVVRTSGDPGALLDTVRREIHAVDPNIAPTDLETMQQYMTLPLFPARTTGLLLGISGFLALTLTSIGLFGVISYIVSQRTHEIGVRMALGARRSDVLKLVVLHGLSLASIGLVIGLAAALAATQLLSSLLYGIRATDPATFVSVAVFLCGVVVLACSVPAWRATRVDPVVALRYE